jgi:DNA-binding IclR family transcriptional regulator
VRDRNAHQAHRLIADPVDSVGALDLLVLMREREHAWTPEEIAGALHCPVPWAEQKLQHLHTGGLLAADGERRYLYRPRTGRLGKAMDALAEAYATRPREVVRQIFAARR